MEQKSSVFFSNEFFVDFLGNRWFDTFILKFSPLGRWSNLTCAYFSNVVVLRGGFEIQTFVQHAFESELQANDPTNGEMRAGRSIYSHNNNNNNSNNNSNCSNNNIYIYYLHIHSYRYINFQQKPTKSFLSFPYGLMEISHFWRITGVPGCDASAANRNLWSSIGITVVAVLCCLTAKGIRNRKGGLGADGYKWGELWGPYKWPKIINGLGYNGVITLLVTGSYLLHFETLGDFFIFKAKRQNLCHKNSRMFLSVCFFTR